MPRKRATIEGVDPKVIRRRAYVRKHYKENKRKHQDQMHKYRYGITPRQYKELLAKQKGCCAVCGTSKNPRKGHEDRMVVDHDHRTGKTRGLLCHRCNIVAGMIESDFTTALKIIGYITLFVLEIE